MTKQSLLLVDGDTRSLRVLEVSLRKAGFTVTPAPSVKEALDTLELHTPDLIISETTFPAPELDGFELRRRVRQSTDWAEIPFVFLTAETAIEHKIRGLELGVDDYLTKPIYIKEIVTRINILLQKRQRAKFEERRDGMRFAGRVADMPVVDVIQTIEVSRKSGVIQFVGERGRQAAIYFRDGKVIDAEAGPLQAEDAVYRLLTWGDGEFEVMFRTVRRREAIMTSSQGLLMEGMRRLDEWSRLLEQLPPLGHRFEVDLDELSTRLGEVPDDNNRILRLLDGKHTLLEVIDASDFGDLECLQAISKLYFEGLLVDLDPDQPAKRITGKPMPLVQVEDEPAPRTPMEEVASGPTAHEQLEFRARRDSGQPPLEPPPLQAPAPEPEPDDIDAEPYIEPEPGPLMGGYRPSSLRLIDEAVAAAQAIEPGLFDDDPPHRAQVMAVAAPEADDDSSGVPSQPFADDAEPPHDEHTNGESGFDHDPPTDPSRSRRTDRREDSGLRMIGSLGRDRAEASGELVPAQIAQSRTSTARELVTIMPRKNTREVPIVVAGTAAADVAKTIEPAAVAMPATPVPRRVSQAGGATRVKPSWAPGAGASVLLVLAALLAGAAVVLRWARPSRSHEPVLAPLHADAEGGPVALVADALSPLPPPPPEIDAGLRADAARTVAPTDAALIPHDAATAPRDALVPRVDAAAAVAIDAAPRVVGAPHDAAVAGSEEPASDRAKQARDLMDQAHDAVTAGEFDKALQLVDSSLKLRRAARTYLIRADALNHLGRTDDALAAIDDALGQVHDYPPALAQKGMLLWSAQRRDEARAAFERYLELDPNGKEAPMARRLLNDPR